MWIRAASFGYLEFRDCVILRFEIATTLFLLLIAYCPISVPAHSPETARTAHAILGVLCAIP
jgi:hypothetical protein